MNNTMEPVKSPIETASAKYPISQMGINCMHNLKKPVVLSDTAPINTKSLEDKKETGVVPLTGDVGQQKRDDVRNLNSSRWTRLNRNDRSNKDKLIGLMPIIKTYDKQQEEVDRQVNIIKKTQEKENELWKRIVSFKKRDYGRSWRDMPTERNPYGRLHKGVRPLNNCKATKLIKEIKKSKGQIAMERHEEKCRENSMSPVEIFINIDSPNDVVTKREKKKLYPQTKKTSRGKHVSFFSYERHVEKNDSRYHAMKKFRKFMDTKKMNQEISQRMVANKKINYLRRARESNNNRLDKLIAARQFESMRKIDLDIARNNNRDEERRRTMARDDKELRSYNTHDHDDPMVEVTNRFYKWDLKAQALEVVLDPGDSRGWDMSDDYAGKWCDIEKLHTQALDEPLSPGTSWDKGEDYVYQKIFSPDRAREDVGYTALINILRQKIFLREKWVPPPDTLTQIERLIEMIILVIKSSSWQIALLQLKVYICTLTNIGLASKVYEYLLPIWSQYQTQAFSDWGEKVKDLFRTVKDARHGDFWNRIVKTVACVVSLGMCSISKIPFCTDQFASWYKVSGFAEKHWFDLTTCIMDTIEFVYDRGLAYFRGHCTLGEFFSGKNVSEYEARYAKIVGSITLYELDKLESIKMTDYTYELALSDLIASTNTLHNLATGVEKRVFAQKMVELARISSRCVIHQKNYRLRKCPFTWMMHGGTGVGKTTLQGQILNAMIRVNNLPTDPRHVCYLNMQDKYQTDISPSSMFYRLDDMGNTKPEYEETPTSQNIINIINNEPKTAIKADLDSKGNVMIKPMIVCGTTNTKTLNAEVTSTEPLSILRRFQFFVRVEVKKEYRTPGTTTVDKTRFKDTEDIVDFWDFTVDEVIPLESKNATGATQGTFRVLSDEYGELKNIGMERLILFLGKQSRIHFEQQSRLLEVADRVANTPLCEHDCYSSICTQCLKPQADEEYIWCDSETGTEIPDSEMEPNHRRLFGMITNESDIDRTVDDYVALTKVNDWVKYIAYNIPDKFLQNTWLGRPFRMLSIQLRLTDFDDVQMCLFDNKERVLGCYLILLLYFVKWSNILVYGPLILLCLVVVYMVFYTYTISVKTKILADTIIDKGIKPYRRLMDNKYKIAAGCGAALSVVLICRRIFKHKKVIEDVLGVQGGKMSDFEAREEKADQILEQITERENIWLKPEIAIVAAAENVKTATVTQVLEVVKKSTASAVFYYRVSKKTCNIFPYRGNCWIAPYHVLRHNPSSVKVTRNAGNLTNTRLCKISIDSWRRVEGTDMVLITLPSCGDVRDFSEFFPEVLPTGERMVHMVHKQVDTSVSVDSFIARAGKIQVPEDDNNEIYVYDGWRYETNDMITEQGLCMAALISEGPIPFIYGFHSAGKDGTKKGAGHFLGKGELMATYEKLYALQSHIGLNVQCHSTGQLVLNYPEYGFNVQPVLHKKSPLNWLEKDGCVLVYGSHGKTRRFDSKVVRTHISPYVEKLMNLPIMHGKPPGMNSYHPWRDFIIPAIEVGQCDPLPMGLAQNDLRNKFEKIADSYPDEIRQIRILSNDEILAGIDGVYAIDAMKLNTSSGFPRCKPKNELISVSERIVEGISRPLDLKQEVWDEVSKMEDILATGTRTHTVHRLNLKDEPTKIGKKKVRVFAGCSIEMLILVRKYFAFAMKFIVEHGFDFETAVGINAFSPEWTKLYKHVTKKSEINNGNGDFKHFDIKTEAHKNMIAFAHLNQLCIRSGNFSDRMLTIMVGIATELSFGTVEMNGDLLQLYGVTLSGHGCTVIINGLNNSSDVRYGFYSVAYAMLKGDWSWFDGMDKELLNEYFPFWKSDVVKNGIPEKFDDVVALITYGDDNHFSVLPGYSWFNHTTLAYALSKAGITYTMADKTAKSVPYIPASVCTFLKRSYIWDPSVCEYKAPLELMSLQKTLHACLKSKAITPKMQSRESILSVMRELYQHGEHIFNEWRDGLTKVIEESGIKNYFVGGDLPTYEFYHEEYKTNAFSSPPKSIGGYVETDILSAETSIDEEDTPSFMCEAVDDIIKLGVDDMENDPLTCQSKYEVTETISSSYDISNVTGGTHQTTVFRDGTPQWATGIPSGYEATREVGMKDNVPLDDFFSRPVEYTLPEWVPGSATPYTAIFNPWTIYFGNKRVINRITNNQLLQCTLKIKFMINGNAFYFGRLLIDYLILHLLNTVDQVATLNRNNIMQASQRMHLLVNPTTSQAGEMSLPFIWPYNALSIPLAEWSNMGQILIREINSLKHANGSTTPVTLSCYIWAENVVFSVPTTVGSSALIPQARTEYGSSPLSNIATATAAAMNGMSRVPIIGPYAKATSMVASGVGAAAKMFGYSRPPQIEDSTIIRPHLVTRLANTDCGDPVAKLTVDSKQELTIDNKVFGADTEDQMTIANIATTESFLTTFAWAVGTAKDAMLFNMRVTPTQGNLDSTLTIPAYNLTAMGFAALPFQWWRGTMRIRFQIVCSEYHRGRLRVVYDPQYIASLESNVAFTRIVDLVNEKEFTMDISWAQAKAYLPVPNLTSLTAWTSLVPYAAASAFANGVVGIYVQNDLTTPNSTVNNDIQINVFVSMCDDVDYAVPLAQNINDLTYSTQALEESLDADENAPVQEVSDNKVLECLPVDHTSDVHFGERTVSFRTLLRRYNYLHSILCPSVGDNQWNMIVSNFPYYRGRYATAINVDSTAAQSNLTTNTLLNYLTPAFIGVRGGMRWKYLYGADKDSNISYAFVDRRPNDTILAYTNNAPAVVTTNVNTFAVSRLSNKDNALTGGEVTYNKAQPVLEVELPYFSTSRFMAAKDVRQTSLLGTQAPNHRLVLDNHNTAVSYVDRYVSTGEDFTLFLFQGAPPMRVITLAAT